MRRFAPTIRLFCLACVAATLASPPAVADDGAAEAEIAARLDDWKDAFNKRAVSRICDLFSNDLVSTVRGRPDEGRDAVCRRIANALADHSFTSRYALDIKEVIVSGDLAVVRLVWSLETRRGGAFVVSKEPGLDVFRREPDGKWRISRFLAFSLPPKQESPWSKASRQIPNRAPASQASRGPAIRP